MAFGDLGGTVTELMVTCRASGAGPVNIARGEAVVLMGPYMVGHATDAGDPVFGQAAGSAGQDGATLPVRVRGVCVFAYTGAAPVVDGLTGVVASAEPGKVMAPAEGTGRGLVVRVQEAAGLVHVLL